MRANQHGFESLICYKNRPISERFLFSLWLPVQVGKCERTSEEAGAERCDGKCEHSMRM